VQRVDLENNRYHSRVWIAATDASTAPIVLSPADMTASLARWSPDGTRIAYTARVLDDDEALTELRVAPAFGDGEHRVVVRWREGPRELEWSPDGSRIAFVARDPDPDRYGPAGEHRKEKDMPPRRIERLFTRLDSVGWISDRPARVFVVAVDNDEGDESTPVSVTPGPFESSGLTWSPDGRHIAFVSGRHDTWDLDWRSDLFAVAIDDPATITKITETAKEYALPSWSPNGDVVACIHAGDPMQGPWHGRIATVPSGGGAPRVLTASLDRNAAPYPPPRGPVWVGESLLFLVDDRGFTHLWRVDTTAACGPEPVIAGPRSVTAFDALGDTIAFVAMSTTSLPEVFVRHGDDERKLTDFTAELDAIDRQIPAPERFVVTASNGEELDCWIIEPERAADAKVPLLLNIHGGPFTAYGDHFFDEFQYEVGAGFAVLFCNPRGSSGGSEEWGRAIRWPEADVDPGSGWGGVDYDDVMLCLDEAVQRYDFIDVDRIGVMGGSYGGYMTSWIIGHTNRFAAAISERSCNNLVSLEYASDVAGSFVSYVGMTHVDDPEPYLRQSPITYVRDMTTPLLILHSENDLRCPINQAEELFVALRLLGRTPEFVRFPGESHELSRSGAPRHRVQRAEIILDFMKRHLT
jgi:dipeptidyl aminopeptidase/acylaminoacyl peptidase